jgi:hypothetical protein
VSGQPSKKVTVKLNGERLDAAKQKTSRRVANGESQPIVDRVEVSPRVTVPERGRGRGDDAWERLVQLRATAAQANKREPVNERVPPYGEDDDEAENGRRFSPRWLLPRGPVLKALLTTGGAVSIGLLFGFLVLTVFTQEQLSQSYHAVLNGTVQSLTAQDVGRNTSSQSPTGPALPAGGEAAGPEVTVSLQLPEQRYFMAQAGAFQPDAPAGAAVEPLEKQGLPHMLYHGGDKQYLFAAAAPTRDEILGFASVLKAKGIEVYVKETVFPEVKRNVSVKRAEEASQHPDMNSFFLTGLQMARTLASQSSQVVNSAQAAFPDKEGADLKEQHRRFLEASRAAQIPEDWQPLFTGMVNGLNQAVTAQEKMAEAVAGKKTDSSESYAWQVQAGVLAYLENYNKWVQLVPSS